MHLCYNFDVDGVQPAREAGVLTKTSRGPGFRKARSLKGAPFRANRNSVL